MNNGPTARSKARAFMHKFKLHDIDLTSLCTVIEQQGYTIVPFNSVFNDANVDALIKALELESNIIQSKGFTYVNDKYRLVFINEDLSDEEKLIVLVHEEGHIFCEHFSQLPIVGKDVRDEYEANEFTHYIMNLSTVDKIKNKLYCHKRGVLIAVCMVLIAIFGFMSVKNIVRFNRPYGEYYVTSAGNVYHKANCIFVKNKDNVHRLTEEEFEQGDYEPCQICLP